MLLEMETVDIELQIGTRVNAFHRKLHPQLLHLKKGRQQMTGIIIREILSVRETKANLEKIV